jgi:hypothetical protein
VLSFYSWTLRLLLLVALYILVVTIRAIWPDGHHTTWLDVAGVGTLAVTALGVGFWTVGAWMGER